MKHPPAPWLTIYMARSETIAQSIVSLLQNEGLLVQVRPVYKNRASEDNYFEIRCLKSEAEEAQEVLMQHGFSGK